MGKKLNNDRMFGTKSAVGLVMEAFSKAMDNLGVLDYKNQEILMEVLCHQQFEHLKSCKREPETIDWIKEYFKPGDVFCDVGANVGAYSLVAWKVMGGSGKVYAFEPSFPTFGALCRNIILNNAADVISLPIALAEKDGLLHFNYSSVSPGGAMHNLSDKDDKSGGVVFSQQIMAYNFDKIFKDFNLTPPTHLKIDVDGGEEGVLLGAKGILKSPSLRSILIEIDHSVPGFQNSLDIIESAGFGLLKRHNRRKGGVYNYIFVK